MKPIKIGIISLGCPRNLVDSERILGRLKDKDYQVVDDIEKADIGIVNTCSFIDEAKKESISSILDLINLKKEGRLRKIIVGGCLVQRYKEELISNLKEVDAFVGRISLDSGIHERYPLSPRHFAYVKISEGCSHSCTFCVIPQIKGCPLSRKVDSIVREVRRLDQEGKSEIIIVGQDISLYGFDLYKELRLTELLKTILKSIKRIRWVRLLYLHPNHITGELISLIANEPKVCKYIDLPLQHINNRLLKSMNRKTTKNKIIRLIERLRKEIPGLGIRTSFIVGFPGESDDQFEELLSFIREQRFERLGVFKYSAQEGTPAYNFINQIPEKIKRKRFDIIMRTQQRISKEFNAGFLSRELEVLIDEGTGVDNYLARLSIDAPEIDGQVYVKAKRPLRVGEFAKVKIVDTYEYDLVGEVV